MVENDNSKSSSSLKLPRVEFDGSNYASWYKSLMIEAKGHGLSMYLEKEIAAHIEKMPSLKTLKLEKITGQVSDVDQHKMQLETMLENEKALALINATLREDYRTITSKETIAYNALELIRSFWHQSTVQHREQLYRQLEAMQLKDGENAVMFLVKCETIKDQLAECGDKTITDSALAEKILVKLPKSMKNLANSVRTYATITEKTISCALLKQLFQAHETTVAIEESLENKPLAEASLAERITDSVTKAMIANTKALIANLKPHSQQQKRKIRSGETCGNCGKEGHTKPNCWADGGGAVGSRPDWWKPKPSAKKQKGGNKDTSKYSRFHKAIVSIAQNTNRDLKDVWISDSGCTTFVTCRKDWLLNFSPITETCQTASTDSVIQITGKGSLQFRMNNKTYVIHDVLYSSDFGFNLFPVNYFDKKGYTTVFKNAEVTISGDDGFYASGQLHNSGHLDGLYILDLIVVTDGTENNLALSTITPRKSSSIQQFRNLHRKLGHINCKALKDIIKSGHLPQSMITGLSEEEVKRFTSTDLDCAARVMGKLTRQSFRNKDYSLRSTRPLGLIHADLIGPISVQTRQKEQYVLTAVDDYTGYTWTILLQDKSKATDEFIDLLTRLSVEQNMPVNTVKYDNGTEIVNLKFRQYCRQRGIKLHAVAAYTPQLNGVSERKNRSLIHLTRTLMADSQLARMYWGYAITYATYLLNVFVSYGRNHSHKSGKSPFELWHGTTPSYEQLQSWGAPVYFRLPDSYQKTFKFDASAAPGFFLGLAPASYLILSTTHKVYTIPRGEVVFRLGEQPETGGDENQDHSRDFEFLDLPQTENNNNSSIIKQLKSNNLGPYWDLDDTIETGIENTTSLDDDLDNVKLFHESKETNRQSKRLASRQDKKLKALIMRSNSAEHLALISHIMSINKTPQTIEEALSSPEKDCWQKAIDSEYHSLIKNGTWEEVQTLPSGRKPLPCKWVFKIKLNSKGGVERYKARLVIKGFKQIEGIDYTETFAPVAKFSTIRLMLAIAASLDLEIDQMDFSTAFLNGDLKEEIYMLGPPGTDLEGKFLKLEKSLYGLKQAPRCWNHKIDSYLKREGFKRCHTDNCLYYKEGFYILLYVDDILLFTNDKERLAAVKSNLMDNFDMHDLGNLEFIVGIRVTRNRKSKKISLDQTAYCERILKKFGFDSVHSVKTPIVDRLVKSNETDDSEFPYRAIVGSLMYLMVGTRPDLAVAISELSRYLENPSPLHVTAAKRVLRYLSGTKNLQLTFDGNLPLQPVAYADADYANDLVTRRSTSGYLIKLCGASVVWKSKSQPVVALSTTEAEYYAASFCCQEICWLNQCLSEIGFKFNRVDMKGNQRNIDMIQTHPLERLNNPIILHEDNQACIAISKNPEKHARTKHIEVKYHFIRDLVENGVVKLVYCNTENQIADVLTKPLAFVDFDRHRKELGIN